MPNFYLFKNDDGEVVGMLQSTEPSYSFNAVQVSEQEYVEAGGNVIAQSPRVNPDELARQLEELSRVTNLLLGVTEYDRP